MTIEYAFKTDTLVEHVIYKLGGYSGVRVHKTIYFIFAFYASTIGLHEGEADYLFKEDFEAWEFGPVLRSLYLDSIDGEVEGVEWIPKTLEEEDLYEFIDDVIESTNKLDDFQLVDRTHEDSAWIKAYNPDDKNNIGTMNKKRIRTDYLGLT